MTHALLALAAALSLTPASLAQPPDGPARLQEVAASNGVQITGVAVTREGRVFVCSPLWHDGHTWSVAEAKPDGSFVPFPDQRWNQWTEDSETYTGIQFVCVQSVYADHKNSLWVLDAAAPRLGPIFRGENNGGGPKLIRFDLETGRMQRIYLLVRAAVDGTYFNDVRIDRDEEVAYISDSGAGGIVLVDLRTSTTKRVLDDHPSTKAAPDFVPVVGGRPLKFTASGEAPRVHADGIALDRERGWLYYQALCAKRLFRVPTAELVKFLRSAHETAPFIAQGVQDLGETLVTDGMEIDPDGNLYLTAIEKNAIVVRTPDGTLHTLAQDERLAWPDSLSITPDGTLYVSAAQTHLTAWFTPDGAMPESPYRVFKTAVWKQK